MASLAEEILRITTQLEDAVSEKDWASVEKQIESLDEELDSLNKMYLYPNGEIKPAHSINPVQFTLISNNEALKKVKLKKGKGLANIAPTILKMIGIKKTKDMEEALIGV